MAIEIRFGHENFVNCKRLSYKWWLALAKFVDNSSQSFFDTEDALKAAYWGALIMLTCRWSRLTHSGLRSPRLVVRCICEP